MRIDRTGALPIVHCVAGIVWRVTTDAQLVLA
jgi:hypothetical protein